METLKGIGVSRGVVIGRAFVLTEEVQYVPRRVVPLDDVDHQEKRFRDAVAASINELKVLRDRVARELDADAANILDFHIGLLSDRHFLDPIVQRINDQHVTAEFAVTDVMRGMAQRFLAMDSEAFRSKASDLLDLDRRLLRHLVGETRDRLSHLQTPAVVIAHELTPSQAASLDKNHVRAFATDGGGQTSHTAIMARSLGIPAVVGLERAMQDVADSDLVIVDGDHGVLVVNPDETTLTDYRRRIRESEAYELSLRDLADLPAVTRDGVAIRLYGNIEFADEVNAIIANGGDGVGLFRSEFLYLTANREPTEEDHFQAYSTAVRLCAGRPLTIRTLDLGSDKYTQQRAVAPERNPALGCRSIRYTLQHLPMFKTQLRAILRASAQGPLRIMFPLITGSMELRQAKMVLADVMEDLDDENIRFDRAIPVGIMIEAPSAAIMAHAFVPDVSFFSIGTNDLTQYTLAVDRTNERVANLYSAANPAVLRLIKDVIRTGRRHRIEVSICGEMAGEPDYTMLLLGMGLRTLSLVPSAIPLIKKVVRSADTRQCEHIARKVGSFDSERQILIFLRDEARKVMSESPGGRAAEA